MYLVDKSGRRMLLLVGAAGMASTSHRSRVVHPKLTLAYYSASQLIVAAVGSAISTDNLAGQQVLIAFVCIFIAFFASTWVSGDPPFLSGRTVLTSFTHKGSSCMGCHRRKYVLHLLH